MGGADRRAPGSRSALGGGGGRAGGGRQRCGCTKPARDFAMALVLEPEQTDRAAASPFTSLGVHIFDPRGRILPGIPLVATAEYAPVPLLEAPPGPVPPDLLSPSGAHRIGLGLLATDHAGYASFSLRRIPVDGLAHLWVEVLGNDAGTPVDALADGSLSGNGVYLRLSVANVPALPVTTGLTSLQEPSLDDSYRSPASLAVNPALVVGEDGCQILNPSQFATREFKAQQLVWIRPRLEGQGSEVPVVDEYTITWYPIGHGLGDVAYSLALAPGESVNLAFIDWAREDEATRGEETEVEERLQHNLLRDRTIEETVTASLREWQRGGSVMGGAAGTYGGGSYGLSGAIGGGYTTSSGDRDLNANTAQTLADSIAQTSSAKRGLTSTVVVQSSQQESQAIQTRVVANHNHCHALTVLYYELLRHFRVETRWTARRPVRLLEWPAIDFMSPGEAGKEAKPSGATLALRHLRVIESVLLDERLRDDLDVLQVLADASVEFAPSSKELDPPAEYELTSFEFLVRTGKVDLPTTFRWVNLITRSEQVIECALPEQVRDVTNGYSLPWSTGQPGGSEELFTLRPQRRVTWNNVAKIQLMANPSWPVDHVVAKTTHNNLAWRMYDGPLPDGRETIERGSVPLPVTAYGSVSVSTPLDSLEPSQKRSLKRVLDHLSANSVYYSRAIWLAEDPDARAVRLKDEKTPDGRYLMQEIENRPLGVFGDKLVFPIAGSVAPPSPGSVVEKLVSVPARGVFAEAKLGSCNACEVIDNTRFWDWQQSPIPEKPTPIEPPSPNIIRYEVPQGVDPSDLPAPVINITNPPAAPDPTGLANALSLMATANIFRDMSAAKEVAALLQSLVAAASAAQGKGTSGGGTNPAGGTASGSGDAGSSPMRTSSSATPRPTPSQQLDQLQVLRNAESNGELTSDQQRDMARDYLESAIAPDASGGTTPSTPQIVGPTYETDYDPSGLVIQENAEGPYGSVAFPRVDESGDVVTFRNWRTVEDQFRTANIDLPYLPGANLVLKPLRQIVIHETQSFSGMNRRPDLSVTQFAINSDGTIYQLADLQARAHHASDKEVNQQSVGIEFVNYTFDVDTDPGVGYKDKTGTVHTLNESTPRTRVPIKWAGGARSSGYLIVPPIAQLEKLVVLVRTLLKYATVGHLNKQGLGVPAAFLNVIEASTGSSSVTKRYFVVKAAAGVQTTLGGEASERRRSPGIISHAGVFEHQDGSFPAMYLWLRLGQQLVAKQALRAAISLSARPLRKVNSLDSDGALHSTALMVDVTDALTLTGPYPPAGTVLREPD